MSDLRQISVSAKNLAQQCVIYFCLFAGATPAWAYRPFDGTDAAVSASISIGKLSEFAFGLSGELDIYLPNIPGEQRQHVVDLAHAICPYSNATRGNMDVVLTIVD